VALADFEYGTVWLAGAGPGDPGMLTLAAAHGLAHADVVMYDALVSDAVLDMAGPGAAREFVGKRGGVKSLKQDEITARMIAHARAGLRVLRLKGGDPFTFARGAEEAMALARAGVRFRVLPGVSAGIGGLAAASIPLTHRDITNAVSFVTGRDATGGLPGNIDWDALAAGSPVLVFFMALRTMPQIAARLLAAGRGAGEAMAVVSDASLPTQSVLVTTLGQAAADMGRVQPRSPAIIAVGEIVKVRAILEGWQIGAAGGATVARTRIHPA
jgi:uroporphyrin-III C-methyltransferase